MKEIELLLQEAAALAARRPDRELLMLFRRRLSKIHKNHPDLSNSISHTISSAGGVGATRSFNALTEVPKDKDSGMELVFRQESLANLAAPLFPPETERQVSRFIQERERAVDLRKAGISAPSSLALIGSPGTGKTSLAKWIASKLEIPFMALNIAGVITSYLGQTGQNLKKVLDRAKLEPCLLLLDEFDALGYHRADDADVGEMRRVVTVLLQEIENWPEHSIIVAATNMPDQIDPAFKRRFSRWIETPLPNYNIRLEILKHYYGIQKGSQNYLAVAAAAFVRASGADLQEFVRRVRTSEIVENISPRDSILQELERDVSDRNYTEKEKAFFIQIARKMDEKKFTYRLLGELLKISHTSARRLMKF
ncbi:ATP-binding protein [Marinifilum sp. JC120]|nr:ATP-binding protein [Marinifilum sp. JC120]